MWKRLMAIALALPLAAPAYATPADPDPDATAAIGRAVGPDVYGASFKDMRDGMHALDAYKGQTLILYFWALWCAPCRIEAVDLEGLPKELAGTNTRFVAIAMSNGDELRQFVADHGIDYTMLYGGANAVTLTKALGNTSAGVPFFAIVRDGKVVDAFHGDRTPAELAALAASRG